MAGGGEPALAKAEGEAVGEVEPAERPGEGGGCPQLRVAAGRTPLPAGSEAHGESSQSGKADLALEPQLTAAAKVADGLLLAAEVEQLNVLGAEAETAQAPLQAKLTGPAAAGVDHQPQLAARTGFDGEGRTGLARRHTG